jgi:hypothetical protein
MAMGAVALGLMGTSSARASIMANVGMTSQQIGGPYPNEYDLTLHNTGDTPIGTYWYAWDDSGLNFLPSYPYNITAPANWFGTVTYSYDSSFNYTYGIEWYSFSPNQLAPGQSLSGFSFQSTDTPDILAGISSVTPINPGDPPFPVGTSFVYMNYPAQQPGDSGFQFVASPAPEPASVGVITAALGGLLLRRRR